MKVFKSWLVIGGAFLLIMFMVLIGSWKATSVKQLSTCDKSASCSVESNAINKITETKNDVSVNTSKPLKMITNEDDYNLSAIIAEFERTTGIKVETSFTEDSILSRLANREEGDIVFNKISSELVEASDKDLLGNLSNQSVTQLDSKYKDAENNKWFNASYRLRSFYIKKGVTEFPKTYEELSDAKYKGKICIRPLSHTYNVQMIAYMISKHGSEYTKNWLNGLQSNLAVVPSGNDRAQIENIYKGNCEIAVANSYYMALMLSDIEQREWANTVNLYFPNQEDVGSLALYNGIGITKQGENNENVSKFFDFLLNPLNQQLISNTNFEYPVVGAVSSDMIKSFGSFQKLKPEDIKIDHTYTQNNIAKHREEALLLVKELQNK